MKCPNCKVRLQKNSKYCPRCGLLFDRDSSTDLSVDNYIGYYIKEFNKGKNPKKFSLLYFLFPFSAPVYYKLPFIAINLLLLILHALFAINYIGAKTGPFAFFYMYFSVAAAIFYWLYNAFKFNELRVENAKIRIWKIEKENKDKSEEEIEELIKEDSNNSIFAFLIPLIAAPIIYYLFTKFLEFLLSL